MRHALLALTLVVGCSSSATDSQTGAPDPDDVTTLTTPPPPGAAAEADDSGVDVIGDWAIDDTDDPESTELGDEPTEGPFDDDDAAAAEEDPVAEGEEDPDSPGDEEIEGVYEGSASQSTFEHPRCVKKIFVSFLTYDTLPELPGEVTNGCWKPQRLMQDPIDPESSTKLYRECHFDRSGHTGGSRWFYDFTDRTHDGDSELKKVAKCNQPGGPGFEMLSPSGGATFRWRIVKPRGSNIATYFAQLWTSEDKLDDLWLNSKAYRKNKYLRKYKRMSPMINVGYLYGATGLTAHARKIRNETLKVCKSMRKGQHLGIYSGPGRPLGGDRESDLRFAAVKSALDECTGVQATCDALGGKICESDGNGACGGKGRPSADCDHCCGGFL